MITVKHVAGGTERLYEAPHGAEYVGPHASWGIGGPHLSIPKAEASEQFGIECRALHRGVAYVMNDTGATIGVYQLGDPPKEMAVCGSTDAESEE